MSIFIVLAYAVLFLLTVTILLSSSLLISNIGARYQQQQYLKKHQMLHDALVAYIKHPEDLVSIQKIALKNKNILLGVIVQLSDSGEGLAKSQITGILNKLGLQDLVHQQLLLLKSSNAQLRLKACSLLPYIADREIAGMALINALNDPMLDIRLNATQGLGKLLYVKAIPAIIEKVSLPSIWPSQRVIEAIAVMGDDALQPLINYLAKPELKDGSKLICIGVLGLLKNSEALPILSKSLDSPSLEIRVQTVKALGLIGDESITSKLCLCMKDSAWEVRAAVASALGTIKNKEAISCLNSGLVDEAWWVRRNAANALYSIGAQGIEALKTNLLSEDRFAREMSQLILDEKVGAR